MDVRGDGHLGKFRVHIVFDVSVALAIASVDFGVDISISGSQTLSARHKLTYINTWPCFYIPTYTTLAHPQSKRASATPITMPELSPSLGYDPYHQPHIEAVDDHPLTIPSNLSTYHQTTTIALAGYNQSFEVNKDSICRASRFFKNALNTPMQEQINNRIELHDYSPATVRWFLDWINNPDVLLKAKLDAELFIDWVDLYKLADFVDVYGLCNDISSIIHDWCKTMYGLPFETDDDLKAMVKYLPPHSGLRRLLIAAAVNSLDSPHCEKCEINILHHYPCDLADAILRSHKHSITDYPQCDFHEHRSWEECELCGEFRDGQFMPPFSAGSSEGW